MNLQMLMIAKRTIIDQLNDMIYSIDEYTHECLNVEDIKFMRSLLIDLNSCKDRILDIYYKRIFGDYKNEVQ